MWGINPPQTTHKHTYAHTCTVVECVCDTHFQQSQAALLLWLLLLRCASFFFLFFPAQRALTSRLAKQLRQLQLRLCPQSSSASRSASSSSPPPRLALVTGTQAIVDYSAVRFQRYSVSPTHLYTYTPICTQRAAQQQHSTRLFYFQHSVLIGKPENFCFVITPDFDKSSINQSKNDTLGKTKMSSSFNYLEISVNMI